jgi:hypothetical protein
MITTDKWPSSFYLALELEIQKLGIRLALMMGVGDSSRYQEAPQ